MRARAKSLKERIIFSKPDMDPRWATVKAAQLPAENENKLKPATESEPEPKPTTEPDWRWGSYKAAEERLDEWVKDTYGKESEWVFATWTDRFGLDEVVQSGLDEVVQKLPNFECDGYKATGIVIYKPQLKPACDCSKVIAEMKELHEEVMKSFDEVRKTSDEASYRYNGENRW